MHHPQQTLPERAAERLNVQPNPPFEAGCRARATAVCRYSICSELYQHIYFCHIMLLISAKNILLLRGTAYLNCCHCFSGKERTQFSPVQSFSFIPYLAFLSPLFSPLLGFSFCSQNFYDSSALFSCSRLVWQPAKWKCLICALSFKTGFMSNCSFQQA